jgi:hypothetical protein
LCGGGYRERFAGHERVGQSRLGLGRLCTLCGGLGYHMREGIRAELSATVAGSPLVATVSRAVQECPSSAQGRRDDDICHTRRSKNLSAVHTSSTHGGLQGPHRSPADGHLQLILRRKAPDGSRELAPVYVYVCVNVCVCVCMCVCVCVCMYVYVCVYIITRSSSRSPPRRGAR